jgi:ketosteroid isomerase-like protein
MIRAASLAVIVLFSIPATFAADAGDRSADHTALRALLVEVTAALNSGDANKLQAYLATPFVITFVDQQRFTDVPAMVAYRAALEKDRHLQKMEVTPAADALTTFLGPDVGYCTGTSNDSFDFPEGTINLSTRWTATLVRQQGAWKVAALHAGVNFLDNPAINNVKSGAKTLVLVAGIAALLIGLVAGLVLGRRRTR